MYRKGVENSIEVTESHSCVGGGCPLSDSSKDGYTNAVTQILFGIRKLLVKEESK